MHRSASRAARILTVTGVVAAVTVVAAVPAAAATTTVTTAGWDWLGPNL